MEKKQYLKELRTIPGVGPSIAEDLWNVDVRRVSDLKNGDPLALYEKIEKHYGAHQDRCLLYVLRCAVYYASNADHDPKLLKWWNWKDARR